MDSIPWVVSIILSYMDLREIGKARGHKDAEAPAIGSATPVSVVSKALTEGATLVDKIRGSFKK